MALEDTSTKREVGCLGASIPFYIANDAVHTFKDFKFSASGRYQQHELIGRKSIVEVIGRKASGASFEITLSEYLGVSVKDTVYKLRDLMENGYAVPLVIGNEPIGDYLWVVESYTVTGELYGRSGELISAKVSVNLLEYPMREVGML